MASWKLYYINWLDSLVQGSTNYCLSMNNFVSALTSKKKKNNLDLFREICVLLLETEHSRGIVYLWF